MERRTAGPTTEDATMTATAAAQILQATDLGSAAFHAGIKCAPCLDKRLIGMLAGRQIGEVPQGQAGTIELMDAWYNGWHAANLAAAVSADTIAADPIAATIAYRNQWPAGKGNEAA